MVVLEFKFLRAVAAVIGDRAEVAVSGHGLELSTLLTQALAGRPEVLGLILAPGGDVRPDLVVLNDGRTFPRDGKAIVRDGDTLTILPIVGGG